MVAQRDTQAVAMLIGLERDLDLDVIAAVLRYGLGRRGGVKLVR